MLLRCLVKSWTTARLTDLRVRERERERERAFEARQPVDDKIIDLGDFEKFLLDRIKALLGLGFRASCLRGGVKVSGGLL